MSAGLQHGPQEYMSIAEAAEFLRLNPRTLRNKMAAGLVRLGVHYFRAPGLGARFKRSALKAWIEGREPAPALAHATVGPLAELVARQGRFSRLTRPFNGLGLPALSVPCGFSSAGLPLAFQIVGRPFDEPTVLRLGDAYQHATDWHTRRPPLD